MADDGSIITDLNLGTPGNGPGNGEDTAPAAGLISQYIKDLSVENPNAPGSFQWRDEPEIDVQFNINAVAVEGEIHEVVLKVTVTARTPSGTAYVVDLAYAGLVGMRNLDDANSHAFLYAEAPRILFPFARRILADAVRDAGYQPLMLDPIDFTGLYMQQLQAAHEAQSDTDGNNPPVGNA